MEKKLSKRGKSAVLKVFLVIIIISGFANCAYLLSIPSDSKNSVFLNYSASRLLLIGFLFFGVLFSFFLFLNIHKAPQKILEEIASLYQKSYWNHIIILFFLLITCVVWFAFFSPTYLLGKYFSIFERLRPILLWLQTVSVVLLLLAVIVKKNWNIGKFIADKKFLRPLILTTCIVFGVFLLTYLIYPRLTDDYSWYGRYSVPILATQIFFSWALITSLKQLSDETITKIPSFLLKNIDWFVFFGIWICAVVLWVSQPIEFMEDLYFTTIEQHMRPFPPTYEIFPWKDSRTYFHITESVVIGNGIYRSIDKSFFLAFESLNNWLADGSYEKMLNLQVGLLAFFPPIIYLLGKELHSRSTGIMGAALAVMQEVNGIGIMDEFPVISSKVLLSEPFMQLWTALIALTAVVAFKRNSKKQGDLFLMCGSVLGLSALFRLNTLVVIPFLLLVIFIYYFHDKKVLFKHACFFIVGIILALTPWMIHNEVKFNDPLTFIKAKVHVINRRQEKITSQENSQYNGFDYSPVIFEISPNFNSSTLLNTNANDNQQKRSKIPILIKYVPSNQVGDEEISTDKEINRAIIESVQLFELIEKSEFSQLSLSVLRHFLNNVIASFSILPTSIIPQDLYHGSRNQRFWGGYDVNLYEGIDPVLLILNLVIVSIGISKAVEKNKIIGLVPLAVYLGYHLSNGFAIASGNRYAQPATWMMFFYFSLGLMVISQWFLHQINNNPTKKKLKTILTEAELTRKKRGVKTWLIIVAILIIGSAPVAADVLPVNRFPKIDDELIALKMLGDSDCQEKIEDAGFTNTQDFLDLINKKGYSASIGRVLEPIQFSEEKFELVYKNEKKITGGDDTFLTFFFLEPKYKNPHYMFFYPKDPNVELHNGSDALIISMEGNEAAVIGIIDPAYALNTISYDDLSSISFSCYFADADNG
jgi:hypothetical protein